MKIASHTPFAPATASVSHGVRKARSATRPAANIAIGPASGARQRSGTRNTRSATIAADANIQWKRSTGTWGAMAHSLQVLLPWRRPTPSFSASLEREHLNPIALCGDQLEQRIDCLRPARLDHQLDLRFAE